MRSNINRELVLDKVSDWSIGVRRFTGRDCNTLCEQVTNVLVVCQYPRRSVCFPPCQAKIPSMRTRYQSPREPSAIKLQTLLIVSGEPSLQSRISIVQDRGTGTLS